MTSNTRQLGKRLLVATFAAGLLVRLAVLTQTANLGPTIIDEQHYTQLAGNLVVGNGFAWGPGQPTSIRPPLYPAVVAGVWTLTGEDRYQVIRIGQMALSAATAWLVFLLGTRLFGPAVGWTAAAVVWTYPSFIFFNVTLLTETLYTFLLTAFVLVTSSLVRQPRPTTAAAAGVLLGLSCLTRSSLWPLPLVLCPLLLLILRAPARQRVQAAALVLAGYAVVVAPWAVRNTTLQGVVTIVDTMGGLNLRMGNYEHTPDDRMWAAVGLSGERGWSQGLREDFPGRRPTEGEKDKWAQRKAIEYMAANPGLTARRSLIRFADFWGLEREYAAGIAQGLYSPSPVLGLVASAVIVLAFVVVSASGVAGVWLARAPDWRTNLVLLLPGLAIMAAHALVFGHSRYHVPLVPVLAVYAASLWCAWPRLAWRWRPAIAGAFMSVAVLVVIWARQVLFVDAGRIQGLFAHAG